MEPDAAPKQTEPFFLIIADHPTRRFCFEGPMTDDGSWKRAAFRAREYEHRIDCGPRGWNRRTLAIDYQQSSGYGGCPPGIILRPRE
jgi:hypothetical protein